MPSPSIRGDLEALRQHRGAAGSLRRENQWPAGTKRLACLGCGRGFVSAQRDIRLCAVCKGDGVPDPLDQRVRPQG